MISLPLMAAWALLLYPYFWQRLEPLNPASAKWVQPHAWARCVHSPCLRTCEAERPRCLAPVTQT